MKSILAVEATKRKIGKVTYVVSAEFSDVAKDDLAQKVEKLIVRGLKREVFVCLTARRDSV